MDKGSALATLQLNAMKLTTISNGDPEKFISCRVGLELPQYREDLAKVLSDNKIYGLSRRNVELQELLEYDSQTKGNFILVPVTSPSLDYFFAPDGSSHRRLNDLILPKHKWENEVAISIGQIPLCAEANMQALKRYDKLLSHALYLPTLVIVIDMPSTRGAQKVLANIINERLSSNYSQRLILIRVFLTPVTLPTSDFSSSSQTTTIKDDEMDNCYTTDKIITNYTDEDSVAESTYDKASSQDSDDQKISFGGWESWDNFRSSLIPDHRIGICLVIDNDMESDDIEDSNRWKGEPVRMVVLSMDRFTSNKGFRNTMRPAGGVKEFLKMLALSNSLMTSFVVQAGSGVDAQEQLGCLSNLCDHLELEYPDYLRAWDDTLLDPLQPLSQNLDSNTYAVFEQDRAKYTRYLEAMLDALICILSREESEHRASYTLMILGAGRGPLVDAMILAIRKLEVKSKHFKIYALDKNSSSIDSLRYKKETEWDTFLPNIETEIVESDMRLWTPNEKADIIATELLGSFSDNELSPECIAGTWRFSSPQTISIPQSYSSFIAPISSFKIRQELHKSNFIACNQESYERLHVVRLRNYYIIDEPKRLFTFEHKRLDIAPIDKANERDTILEFRTEVNTTCHGFAGFFEAQLYGKVGISTNPRTKTPTMESWFPAYVPIEEPIHLSAGSSLSVKFSRKEDSNRVWYEWTVMTPKQSKIHCKDGIAGYISKIIE